MQASLKQKWSQLSPARKKKAVMLSILLGVLVVGFLGYMSTRGGKTESAASGGSANKALSLDSGLLKKSEYFEDQKQIADLKNEVDGLKKLKEQKEQAGLENGVNDFGAAGKKPAHIQPPIPKYFPPLPEAPGSSNYPPGYPPSPEKELKNVKPAPATVIGGIEVVSGPPDKEAPEEKPTGAKKKPSVYLPPSFMEATLLSGLDAPTAEGAKGEPVPVLLRVKNLAVLPNKIKANLKGCFVIAEGYGSLADERAHLRLVTLSCIAKNGSAVIDQKVKGFVVDEDGKIGLRGKVVSKMGSALARSMIAGFFGGLGQATQAATMTTSISALGTTQSIQPSKILEAGAGSGIAQGASELQKFYLSLAKQSMPVVEVGATKNVTLVISEGVDLQIKNFCNQMGDDQCKN